MVPNLPLDFENLKTEFEVIKRINLLKNQENQTDKDSLIGEQNS